MALDWSARAEAQGEPRTFVSLRKNDGQRRCNEGWTGNRLTRRKIANNDRVIPTSPYYRSPRGDRLN
jgi:hypothetical protein